MFRVQGCVQVRGRLDGLRFSKGILACSLLPGGKLFPSSIVTVLARRRGSHRSRNVFSCDCRSQLQTLPTQLLPILRIYFKLYKTSVCLRVLSSDIAFYCVCCITQSEENVVLCCICLHLVCCLLISILLCVCVCVCVCGFVYLYTCLCVYMLSLSVCKPVASVSAVRTSQSQSGYLTGLVFS